MRFNVKKLLGRVGAFVSGPFVVVAALAAVPAILFLPKLGSLAPVGTLFEQFEYLGAHSGSALYNDALHAPIRAVYYAINSLNGDTFQIRLVAAVVAAAAGLCVFLVLKRWHTMRITVLASWMFISSSWVLHAARFASIEVIYLLVIPALFLIGSWAISKSDDNKLPIAVLLLAIILYVPGSWLFILAGAVLFRNHIKRIWGKINIKVRLAGLGALMLLLAPLIASFVHRPSAFVEWLGISNLETFGIDTIGKNLAAIPDALFWSGLDEPINWLNGTPILDYFALAMFILGCFAYRIGGNPYRERIVFASLLISLVLIAFGGIGRLGIIIPLLYIIMANGIAYMLQSWFTVFPRNPLARSIGISLVVAAVLVSSSYQLQRYFIAWPSSPVIEQLKQ